jgi:hypothetical protein
MGTPVFQRKNNPGPQTAKNFNGVKKMPANPALP